KIPMAAYRGARGTGPNTRVSEIVLKPYDRRHGTEVLGNVWSLRRESKKLTCALSTHVLGWELRATIGEMFVRSEVCPSEVAVFDTAHGWRRAAVARGWTAT